MSPVVSLRAVRTAATIRSFHASLLAPWPPTLRQKMLRHGKGLTTGRNHRSAAQEGGYGRSFNGRRHDQELEIFPEVPLNIQAQGQGQVCLEAPFVKLIENDHGDPIEAGSSMRRRVRMPSVTTSRRVSFDIRRSKRMV